MQVDNNKIQSPRGKFKVWNSKTVAECVASIEHGEPVIDTPFHEGNLTLKKADLNYEYSDWELKEIAKCASDVVYFANNYAVSMTDEGVQRISLRDYQQDIMRSYQDHRFIVFCASRQIGKCYYRHTKITIKSKLTNNTKILPLFFVYFSLNPPIGMFQKMKFLLYKIEAFLTDGITYSKSDL